MSLKDIARFFKSDCLNIQSNRCLNPKHRLEYCNICVETCPQQAITVSASDVIIEPVMCNNCGLCVSDCPTEVFRHEHFDVIKLLEWAQHRQKIHIGCAAAATDSDMATIPCHGILTETLLAALYAKGVDDVYLYGLDACSSCPTRIGRRRIDAVVQHSDKSIPLNSIPLLHMQDETTPDEKNRMPNRLPSGIHPGHDPLLDRRQFLSVFGRKSATMMVPSAVKQLLEEHSAPEEVPDIGGDEQILMHKHVPAFHRLAIMSLFSKRVHADASHFHAITANDTCTGCQSCALRCPTGALLWREQQDEVNLEYRALACIGCGLCVSICPHDALQMTTARDIDALREDIHATLFHSQQKYCANCGERYLVSESPGDYCLHCDNEKSINSQWNGYRITGPMDR